MDKKDTISDTEIKEYIKLVIIGTYLGYSKESILNFIQRRRFRIKTKRLADSSYFFETKFIETGFIPTIEEVKAGFEHTVEQINKRRFCPYKFPITPKGRWSSDLDGIMNCHVDFKKVFDNNLFFIINKLKEGEKHNKTSDN